MAEWGGESAGKEGAGEHSGGHSLGAAVQELGGLVQRGRGVSVAGIYIFWIVGRLTFAGDMCGVSHGRSRTCALRVLAGTGTGTCPTITWVSFQNPTITTAQQSRESICCYRAQSSAPTFLDGFFSELAS